MRTKFDAKLMAKTLREELARRESTMSHSECLEIVARQLGCADWNVLSASLQVEYAAASSIPSPSQVGEDFISNHPPYTIYGDYSPLSPPHNDGEFCLAIPQGEIVLLSAEERVRLRKIFADMHMRIELSSCNLDAIKRVPVGNGFYAFVASSGVEDYEYSHVWLFDMLVDHAIEFTTPRNSAGQTFENYPRLKR